MNFNDYFDPIDINLENDQHFSSKEHLYDFISIHTNENKIKNIEGVQIALVGVLSNNTENNSSGI